MMRRLQETGWNAGVSLFMWFVNLQKAYDTVDRTLMWQIVTRIRVPPQMMTVIQQFHDGMRGCVRPDDGVCSDWFKVEQGQTTARMRGIPAVFQHLLRSRADRYSPEIKQAYGRPRRAGTPEGTADVDGTGAGYGLRSSCDMGHTVRG